MTLLIKYLAKCQRPPFTVTAVHTDDEVKLFATYTNKTEMRL